MTAVKGSFEENSPTDLRLMFRFLNEPSFPVTVCDFAKQREEELFLAYLINSPLIKAFFLLEGWNNSKGLLLLLLRYIQTFFKRLLKSRKMQHAR